MSGQGNDKDGMQPIGDIIKMSDMPKRIKRESRLMLAAGEIHDLTTLERDDVSYWPRGLVQCTLPEQRVPADHPLRAVRALTDEALQTMSRRFASLYATTGRPSIPPEQLLRALLLQVLYTVRSERLLMEELNYNLLFRWFVGLNMDDPVWHPTRLPRIVTGCCRAMSPPRSLMRSRPTPGWPGCSRTNTSPWMGRSWKHEPEKLSSSGERPGPESHGQLPRGAAAQ